MKLLRTLKNEDFGFDPIDETKLVERNAARAVVLNDKNEVAIIPVKKENSFYHKIPGGGIENGEDIEVALKREVLEELGGEIEIIDEIGEILEFRAPIKQISYCYLARLASKISSQNLTDFEKNLGFEQAEWLPIDEAIKTFEKDKPKSYHAVFMSFRDKIFLEEAMKYLADPETSSG